MLRRLPTLLLINSLNIDIAVIVAFALVAGRGSFGYVRSGLERLEHSLAWEQVLEPAKAREAADRARGWMNKAGLPDLKTVPVSARIHPSSLQRKHSRAP